jgi:hypothetical protein
LQCGNDGGLGGDLIAAGARFFLFGLHHLFEEQGDCAFSSGGVAYFCAWCEDA